MCWLAWPTCWSGSRRTQRVGSTSCCPPNGPCDLRRRRARRRRAFGVRSSGGGQPRRTLIADPARAFASGAKPTTAGESADSRSSGSADVGRRAAGRADVLSARGLQPAAPRSVSAACCCALGVWPWCPPCSRWFFYFADAEAEQPQRTQRPQSRANGGPAAGRPAAAVRVGRRGLSWRRLLVPGGIGSRPLPCRAHDGPPADIWSASAPATARCTDANAQAGWRTSVRPQPRLAGGVRTSTRPPTARRVATYRRAVAVRGVRGCTGDSGRGRLVRTCSAWSGNAACKPNDRENAAATPQQGPPPHRRPPAPR